MEFPFVLVFEVVIEVEQMLYAVVSVTVVMMLSLAAAFLSLWRLWGLLFEGTCLLLSTDHGLSLEAMELLVLVQVPRVLPRVLVLPQPLSLRSRPWAPPISLQAP